jgi:hypothetical protein
VRVGASRNGWNPCRWRRFRRIPTRTREPVRVGDPKRFLPDIFSVTSRYAVPVSRRSRRPKQTVTHRFVSQAEQYFFRLPDNKRWHWANRDQKQPIDFLPFAIKLFCVVFFFFLYQHDFRNGIGIQIQPLPPRSRRFFDNGRHVNFFFKNRFMRTLSDGNVTTFRFSAIRWKLFATESRTGVRYARDCTIRFGCRVPCASDDAQVGLRTHNNTL